MKESAIIKKIRKSIPAYRKKYMIKRLGVFGSYARGEQTKKSDLDLLVEFESPLSLLEYLALERELSDLSGRKVDLVMKIALKPRIGERVLKEVVYL
jgi:uncharacterized protein